MTNGWIKIYRQMWDNPVTAKDAEHIAVWIYLLTHATHKNYDTLFGGKRITLQPGQLIIGRKKIAEKLSVTESKVWRILKELKSEQQIEQQANSQGSLITIKNWSKYQISEHQIEQPANSERTASEQRVNTIQEYKEYKEHQECKEVYPGMFSNAAKMGLSVPEYFKLIKDGGNQ